MKMRLKIKEDIPLKYHLNMHLMESYIDKDSIGFELIRYIINDINGNDNKDLTLENLKFTAKTLKYVFGDKMQNDEFKNYTITSLKQLIALNFIEPKGKSMYITEEMLRKFYNITAE